MLACGSEMTLQLKSRKSHVCLYILLWKSQLMHNGYHNGTFVYCNPSDISSIQRRGTTRRPLSNHLKYTIEHYVNPLVTNGFSHPYHLDESKRKAMNRNWSNQKANPALKTKTGNK